MQNVIQRDERVKETHIKELGSAEHNNIQRAQIDPDVIQELLSQSVKVISEVVNEKLQVTLMETIYLSHNDMLHEIYMQEEKWRREEV